MTAADVVIATQSISGGEALERRIGGADALVTATGGGQVQQAFDPNDGSSWSGGSDVEVTTVDDVRRVLGGDARAVELREGGALVVTDRGKSDVQVTEVDLRDPLAAGLFELEEGRLPASADEVVVNADLASRGPGSATSWSSPTAPAARSSGWPSRRPTPATRSPPGPSVPSTCPSRTPAWAPDPAGWSTPDRSRGTTCGP